MDMAEGVIFFLIGLGTVMLISVITIAIPYFIAGWKLLKKAGKGGWEILIPFYNTYVLVKIAGLNWWYFLIAISGSIVTLIRLESLSIITNLASIFVNFLIFYNIAKKMRQNEVLYGVLGALFNPITIMILGFSKSITYDNTIEVSPNGPIGAPQTNNYSNNNTPERYCTNCGQKKENNNQFCTNCGNKIEK